MECERDIVGVDEVRVPAGRRELNPAAVKGLAESMKSIGLQCPITIRIVNTETENYVELVTGGHRLAAAKSLGWKHIDCATMPADATVTDARLWEISENLHRADLTPAERTLQLGEWVRLKERQAAEKLPHGVAVSGGRGNEGGVRDAARELGVNRETARRAAKAYDLPEPVKADIVAHGLGVREIEQVTRAPEPAAKLAEIVEQKAAPKPKPAPIEQPRISSDEITREGKAFARKARANIDPEDWREWLSSYIAYLENML